MLRENVLQVNQRNKYNEIYFLQYTTHNGESEEAHPVVFSRGDRKAGIGLGELMLVFIETM